MRRLPVVELLDDSELGQRDDLRVRAWSERARQSSPGIDAVTGDEHAGTACRRLSVSSSGGTIWRCEDVGKTP